MGRVAAQVRLRGSLSWKSVACLRSGMRRTMRVKLLIKLHLTKHANPSYNLQPHLQVPNASDHRSAVRSHPLRAVKRPVFSILNGSFRFTPRRGRSLTPLRHMARKRATASLCRSAPLRRLLRPHSPYFIGSSNHYRRHPLPSGITAILTVSTQ